MQITTPCTDCRINAEAGKAMYADRGLDWPMTDVEGHPVHKACASGFRFDVAAFDRSHLVDGALVWQSNGQHPFDDMLATWVALGFTTETIRQATAVARAQAVRRFLADYRAAQAARTPEQIAEERAEMRAAFGPGETVVNVLTGARTTL